MDRNKHKEIFHIESNININKENKTKVPELDTFSVLVHQR